MKNTVFGLSKAVGALALATGLFATPAAALTIPFEVENFTSPLQVPAEFTGGLSVGDPFSLTFDPIAAAPLDPNNLVTSATTLSLDVGGTTLTFDQPGNTTIQVTDGVGNDADTFSLDYAGSALIDGLGSQSFFLFIVTLRFIDTEGDAFSSPDVPTGFDFSLFETKNITIQALGFDSEFLQGNAVVSAVPLPAALPLMLSALGGIGFLSWRRKKSA